MNKKWLAGPYLVWMVGFIVIPLLLIVYYGRQEYSGACCPSAPWLERLTHEEFYHLYCQKLPKASDWQADLKP